MEKSLFDLKFVGFGGSAKCTEDRRPCTLKKASTPTYRELHPRPVVNDYGLKEAITPRKSSLFMQR